MKINYYYINLERSKDRRIKIENRFKKANIHPIRIEAVDGVLHTYEYFKGYDRLKRSQMYHDLSLSELACIESHRRALSKFLASDAEFAVILEDDAGFDHDLDQKVKKVLNAITGFDGIKIHNEFFKKYKTIAGIDGGGIITHSKIGHGATGFVFSKLGAKKLFESLKSYSQAYDTHIGVYWKYNLYIVALADSLIKPSGCESDIGSRPVGKSSKKPGLLPYIRRFIARMESIFMRRLWGYFVIPSHIKIIIK